MFTRKVQASGQEFFVVKALQKLFDQKDQASRKRWTIAKRHHKPS